jgi:hypothetical protein
MGSQEELQWDRAEILEATADILAMERKGGAKRA